MKKDKRDKSIDNVDFVNSDMQNKAVGFAPQNEVAKSQPELFAQNDNAVFGGGFQPQFSPSNTIFGSAYQPMDVNTADQAYQACRNGDYVLMPPIVQPVAMATRISMQEKELPPPPQTVSEVLEICAPEYSNGSARVAGFVCLISSIITALPFLLKIANTQFTALDGIIDVPNLSTKLALAMNTTSLIDKIPAFLLIGGVGIMFINCVLGLVSLMSAARIVYTYTGAFAMLFLVGSQFVENGALDIMGGSAGIVYVSIVGIGLMHLFFVALATTLCPKRKKTIKGKKLKL
jgi:hypothetical protein